MPTSATKPANRTFPDTEAMLTGDSQDYQWRDEEVADWKVPTCDGEASSQRAGAFL